VASETSGTVSRHNRAVLRAENTIYVTTFQVSPLFSSWHLELNTSIPGCSDLYVPESVIKNSPLNPSRAFKLI